WADAVPPAAATSSATARQASRSRDASATVTPRLASSRATARPIPRLAPVTIPTMCGIIGPPAATRPPGTKRRHERRPPGGRGDRAGRPPARGSHRQRRWKPGRTSPSTFARPRRRPLPSARTPGTRSRACRGGEAGRMTRWQMFTEALAEWRQERSERRALEHTLSAFARIHPTWHGALFDEPFLRRFAPRALLALSPRELAVEWSRQFSYGDQRRRERDIRRV